MNTQSAAERRAAEAQLHGLIARHAGARQRLVTATLRWLRQRLPTAHEVVYEYGNLGAVVVSFSPNEHGYAGVLGIRADAAGVRIFFNRAKELPDPEKLLRGSGTQARWIQLESASTLAHPAVGRLFDEAIARNPVPFARSGRGPVIIQSVSAKPPRRRKQA
jgi:hypothetical protein